MEEQEKSLPELMKKHEKNLKQMVTNSEKVLLSKMEVMKTGIMSSRT